MEEHKKAKREHGQRVLGSVTMDHFTAGGCVALESGARLESAATIGQMKVHVFRRAHCKAHRDSRDRSGRRSTANVRRTITHERLHVERLIAVLNEFNNPARSGVPKVGDVFETLAACKAAEVIWKDALDSAFKREKAQQVAHCDHLGQPMREVVNCDVSNYVIERNGAPYTDTAGVCE